MSQAVRTRNERLGVYWRFENARAKLCFWWGGTYVENKKKPTYILAMKMELIYFLASHICKLFFW